MRNKLAKRLRRDVMLSLYVGDGVTAEEVIKGKHDCAKEPEFKRTMRARKKNEKHPPSPEIINPVSDPEMKRLCNLRLKKRKYFKQSKSSKK